MESPGPQVVVQAAVRHWVQKTWGGGGAVGTATTTRVSVRVLVAVRVRDPVSVRRRGSKPISRSKLTRPPPLGTRLKAAALTGVPRSAPPLRLRELPSTRHRIRWGEPIQMHMEDDSKHTETQG